MTSPRLPRSEAVRCARAEESARCSFVPRPRLSSVVLGLGFLHWISFQGVGFFFLRKLKRVVKFQPVRSERDEPRSDVAVMPSSSQAEVAPAGTWERTRLGTAPERPIRPRKGPPWLKRSWLRRFPPSVASDLACSHWEINISRGHSALAAASLFTGGVQLVEEWHEKLPAVSFSIRSPPF